MYMKRRRRTSATIEKLLRCAIISSVFSMVLSALFNILAISLKRQIRVGSAHVHVSMPFTLFCFFYIFIVLLWVTCLYILHWFKRYELTEYEEKKYDTVCCTSFIAGIMLMLPIFYFFIPIGFRVLLLWGARFLCICLSHNHIPRKIFCQEGFSLYNQGILVRVSLHILHRI